jgi:hypothetical protein
LIVFQNFITILGDRKETIFETQSKIDAMKAKLELFKTKLESGVVTCFPILEKHLGMARLKLPIHTRRTMICHIEKLRENFEKYFPSNYVNHSWLRNPFLYNVSNIPMELSDSEQEELIDVTFDEKAKNDFKEMSLYQFWATRARDYPQLWAIAAKILSEFSNTYLSERTFSIMNFQKNIRRNRLEVEHDLRIKISNRIPNFKKIIAGPKNSRFCDQ